jgi:hypothetical protein
MYAKSCVNGIVLIAYIYIYDIIYIQRYTYINEDGVNSVTLMNQVSNTTLSRTSSYTYSNLWTGYQFLESQSPIQFSI